METNTATPVLTEDDFTRAGEALQTIRDFEERVLTRFKSYALANLGFDVDAKVKQSGGYLSFAVQLPLRPATADTFTIVETMASDRGPSSQNHHKVAKQDLLATSERENDMAEFIRLRDKLGL